MTEQKKRTRVNIVNDATWAMCLGMPNIVVSGQDASLPTAMCVIAYNVAREHPEWTLNARVGYPTYGQEIKIYAGTEHLATVGYTYSRRSGNSQPTLKAHRMQNSGRKGTVTASEPTVLLRKIREFVYPKTLEEYMSGTLNYVSSAMYDMRYSGNSKVTAAAKEVRELALEFCMRPEILQQFSTYVKRNGKEMPEIETLANEVTLIEVMGQQAGGALAVAVQLNNKWRVKWQGRIFECAEDAVPEELHNLHILKMTPERQAIERIGVNLGKDTYIIIPA